MAVRSALLVGRDLPSHEYSLYKFLLVGLSYPKAIVRLQGLGKLEENSVT
jgi:hypothetical protein